MKRIITCLSFFALLYSSVLQAQTADPAYILPSRAAGQARMCTYDAGNIASFGPRIGQSNDFLGPIKYLCLGDSLFIDHDGNSLDLSGDPNMATRAGVGYVFYFAGCTPTSSGPDTLDIQGDPCIFDLGNPGGGFYVFTGNRFDGDVAFFNDGSLQTAFNGGQPIQISFAPITFDSLRLGRFATYEGDCVDVSIDQVFTVAYLNAITVNNVTTAGCTGTFRVRGGLPELDASNYTSIRIELQGNPGVTGTITGPVSHDGVVNFTVPEPGNYIITVEDGKSCEGTATASMSACNGMEIAMPFTNAMPGTTECVQVTVEGFVDIVSAQFTIEWDPTILDLNAVQGFNPSLPDLGTFSFAWNDNAPNIPPGIATFSWNDAAGSPHTLNDGAVFFELCFSVIGQLGDCSPLSVTSNRVAAEIISTGGEVTLVPRDGKVIVSNDPFFFLTEVTPVTCADAMNGAITITVDEGIAPYTYRWNTVPLSGPNRGPFNIGTNGTTSTISNLAAGLYQITITDSDVPTRSIVDTVEVTAGPSLGVSVEFTAPNCFGASNGQVRAVVSLDGVVIPNPGAEYTYRWNIAGQTTRVLDNRAAGFYAVTVTDQNGCTATASVTMTQPSAVIILANNTFVTNASCTGGEDGSISVTATGGTPNMAGAYTFAWDNGLGTVTATNSTVDDLNPGEYCVTVTDANGCTFTDCYTVGAVKTLSINAVITDVDCFGNSTGEIFITGATSGAPAETPYTFTWSANAPAATNTMTTSEITGLAAGIYSVAMTDAGQAGCIVRDTFEVVQPLALNASVLNVTNETCALGNDGTITLQVSGGTTPYTYMWSHSAAETDSLATGLAEGMYAVTITDAQGCTQMLSQGVTAPAGPVVTMFNDDAVTCADDTDGVLQITAVPSSAAIANYNWSTGQSGANLTILTALAPGMYIVTITAVDQCTTVDTAFVTSPPALVIDSVRVNMPNCPGDANGLIAIFASGGTGNYTYQWSIAGAPPINPLPALSAGTYRVTVTDAVGCTTESGDIAVTDPPSITGTFSNLVATSCPDDTSCDGQATFSALYSDNSAGTFRFTWSSGEEFMGVAASTAIQLCEGPQRVTVTDNNSCAEVFDLDVAAPDEFSLNTVIEPVTCNGLSDGSVSVAPAGGTGPYSFFWVETGQNTASINSLNAGTYNLVLTDDNNCTFTQSVIVQQPAPLTVDFNAAQSTDFVTCAGDEDGVILAEAIGGNVTPAQPYSYVWSNGATVSLLSNLPAGTYGVTVTDFKGCTANGSFTILTPEPISFTLAPIEAPLCFGDATLVMIDTAFGGANNAFEEYTFSLDNNGLNFPVTQPATVFAGDHIITVEDVNGCTEEMMFSIVSPPQISIVLPDRVVVELGDSTVQLLPTIAPSGTYAYQWTPADYLSSDTVRSPFVFPERSQDYTLTVVNENGCTATASVFVELDANRNVYIPNIFSPNLDGYNDEFRVFSCRGVRNVKSVRLFDRWGGLLFEAQDLAPDCLNGSRLWDGTKNGDTLPAGVYVYMVEVEFLDDVVLIYRGDVAIIR